jgi:hypothetical protein
LLHCGGSAEFILNVINSVIINGPTTVCPYSSPFYTNPSGENTSWKLKDATGTVISNLPSSADFSYNFTQAGNYSLVAGGLNGCSDAVLELNVVASPNSASVINGAQIICPNAPYTYTVPGNNSDGTYQWQISGGTFVGSSTGNTVVVQFNANATHSLTIFNQSNTFSNCISAPTSITILNQSINSEISNANTILCANTNASYSSIKQGITPEQLYTDGETFNWSIWNGTNTAPLPNAGSITLGQNTNSINILWNNVSVITTVTLRLEIQKCTLNQVFTKNITINPVAQLVLTASSNSICSGDAITFILTSSNGVIINPGTTVTWNYGNGETATLPGLLNMYQYGNTSNANVGFNVTASITNPNGCIGIATSPAKLITVLPAPSAAISISSGGNAYCPPENINTVVTATTSPTGATIKWFKIGNSAVLSTANTLNITNSLGYGGYYFVATNSSGCSTRSNSIYIISFCASGECIISPNPTVTNTSSLGCIAPTTSSNCNCGMINLSGTATGTPISQFWDIYGPNASNSFFNFTGNSLGNASNPLLPGEYNIFKKAKYTCTNGQLATVGASKKITVPYYTNFSYTIGCNGNNFNIELLDTSPFFTPVINRTFKYYIKPTASSTYTLVSNSQNYNITNLSAGNYNIKLVVTGILNDVAQTPCEKIIQVVLAGNTTQTITASIIPANCYNSSIQFELNGPSNAGDTYLWDFGDGSTNTLAITNHVFSTSGFKTVTLQIKNKYGCLKPLLIYQLTIPEKCFNGTVISTPPNASVCNGSSIVLQYQPNNDVCTPSNYIWMEGNNTLGLNTSSIQVSTPGFYWVKVISSNNCIFETPNRITPLFFPEPTLEVTPLPLFCFGAEVPIHITSNAQTISWVIDNIPYSNFSNLTSVVVPSGLTPGSHSVVVTATSNQACTKTISFNIEIANSPPPPIITANLISCDPYQFQLTATGSFGNYTWSNGQNGASIAVNNGGTYQVSVAAGDCTVKSSITLPKDPEEYMWIFPSGCYANCISSLATLIGPSVGYFKYWEWLQDGMMASNGIDAVPNFQLAQSGTYNLTLQNDYCSRTSSDLNYTASECIECPITTRLEKINLLVNLFATPL